LNFEGCFDLQPDVKYPHLGATILPNLGAKLYLSAMRNELNEISGTKGGENYKNRIASFIAHETKPSRFSGKIGPDPLFFSYIILKII